MSFVLLRTLAARHDLIDIWRGLARHGEALADRHFDRLEDAIAGLADFPAIGAPRDDVRPGLRAVLRSPYLIFYTIDERERSVTIVRVVDARRDLEAIFHP